MHPPLTEEQWDGMRELRSLLPPNFQRIAKIADCHVTTVRERASRENWPKLHVPKGSMMRVVTQKDLRDEASLRAEVNALAATGDSVAREVATMELAANLSPGDMTAQLVGELRKILSELRIGHVDKARIDDLLSVARLAERLDGLMVHAIQPEQKRSDDELAEILALIDRRIVELARDYAERLVAREYKA
ncbi:MAG: hypothetical protein JNK47_17385 [Mesorhizobium sp.]|nr:hypothetical protein [Mesorhizobium sp.]MBL8578995.1 hypothetical protein [Mesorhizobium sp.]